MVVRQRCLSSGSSLGYGHAPKVEAHYSIKPASLLSFPDSANIKQVIFKVCRFGMARLSVEERPEVAARVLKRVILFVTARSGFYFSPTLHDLADFCKSSHVDRR
jgi:hypothetical protein